MITENELLQAILDDLPPLFDPCVHLTPEMLCQVLQSRGEDIKAVNCRDHLRSLVDAGKMARVEVRMPGSFQVRTAYVRVNSIAE
jgi:hypothetical protein